MRKRESERQSVYVCRFLVDRPTKETLSNAGPTENLHIQTHPNETKNKANENENIEHTRRRDMQNKK